MPCSDGSDVGCSRTPACRIRFLSAAALFSTTPPRGSSVTRSFPPTTKISSSENFPAESTGINLMSHAAKSPTSRITSCFPLTLRLSTVMNIPFSAASPKTSFPFRTARANAKTSPSAVSCISSPVESAAFFRRSLIPSITASLMPASPFSQS